MQIFSETAAPQKDGEPKVLIQLGSSLGDLALRNANRTKIYCKSFVTSISNNQGTEVHEAMIKQ